jgi:hypothetical protein
MRIETSQLTRKIPTMDNPRLPNFEAIVMIEMDVHRRDLTAIMLVVRIRQALREFAGMIVEQVGKRCDALP